MCLVPGLVILLLYGFYGWGLLVFAVAGVTDALDGLASRLLHQRTELGTMLDPLADKLLVTSSLVVLSWPSASLVVPIPVWITILSISRDAGILWPCSSSTSISEDGASPELFGKSDDDGPHRHDSLGDRVQLSRDRPCFDRLSTGGDGGLGRRLRAPLPLHDTRHSRRRGHGTRNRQRVTISATVKAPALCVVAGSRFGDKRCSTCRCC